MPARLRCRPDTHTRPVRRRRAGGGLPRFAAPVGGTADLRHARLRHGIFYPLFPGLCVLPKPPDQPPRGERQLAKTFLSLQNKGAHNINLVTGAHYAPQVIEALAQARLLGLNIPIVYNSSGYESEDTLALLDGWIDIYLPDYKYYSSYYAARYSHAEDYRETAVDAIAEMVRQSGPPQYDANGLLLRGTIIRHLMLPGLAGDTAQVLRDIAVRFSDTVLVSLMRQYTPFDMECWPELNRTVTDQEYEDACTLFRSLGLSGFFQQEQAVGESFIPAFDGSGLEEEK